MSEQKEVSDKKATAPSEHRISIGTTPSRADHRLSIGTVSVHKVEPSDRRISLASVTKQAGKSTSRLKMRRRSFGFSGVAGVRQMDRSSTTAIEYRRPQLIYLPTYQLNSTKPFDVDEVTLITNKVLDVLFTGHKYSQQESPQMSMNVATEIMRTCKERHYNRYRIIAVVTIGQKRAQSYNNAISFLWDHERDAYVDTHRETSTYCIYTGYSIRYIS